MQTTTKRTITFAELIDYTGMSRKQLQHWINIGVLKFINSNISGSTNVRYLFVTSAVDQFIERIQQTMIERK